MKTASDGKTAQETRADWISWLEGFGIGAFYDYFLNNCQDALSTCIYCAGDRAGHCGRWWVRRLGRGW